MQEMRSLTTAMMRLDFFELIRSSACYQKIHQDQQTNPILTAVCTPLYLQDHYPCKIPNQSLSVSVSSLRNFQVIFETAKL